MNSIVNKNIWIREESMDILIKVVTFLISPFLAFLYSLRRIKTKSSFLMFFLFALIYGLCFSVVADNDSIIETSDAAKWRFRFESIGLETFSDFEYYCIEYFKFAGAEIRDLFFGTITFIVHQFTDNYHFFFFTIALVFSYFQLKSTRFLVSSPSFDNSFVCLMICMLFCMNTIANISGVRFFTAAWMCVYGILQYYYKGRKIYLALLITLPLIHRGFFFLYPILISERFIQKKKIWTIGFFISFFISGLSLYVVRDATSYLPAFLSNMLEAYTGNTIIEKYSFTKLLLSSLSNIYINTLFVLIMIKRPKTLSVELERLYQFTLVLLTIVNFVMPIPSLGGRFMVICYSLIALLWLNIMGTRNKCNYLIYLMPLFMGRGFYMVARNLLRYQEISFFFTNPFSLIYSHL